ncbi:MAG: hypothetical protein JWQ09_1859 [Segetibacter sp.]|nr:hypothetical protein [Segetibacter sp.]
MNTPETSLSLPAWKGYEKVLFRFFFIYLLIQALPLDWKYFQSIFSVNWLHADYGDIFNLTRYSPKFFAGTLTYANWVIVGLVALAGTAVWTARDKKSKEYNALYYWLRVIVRYRLAIGLIAYGFIKLFPLQAPLPSISNLNTHYGFFTRWKLFSLSLGIVPGYESFLGLIELIAGLLLLYRKTATIGAFLIIFFTGNVFMSNVGYEGGEYVYSLYLVSFALFLFAYDAPRLYKLLALGLPTKPNRFKLSLSKQGRTARIALKATFIFFFVFLYGFKTYSGYHQGPYRYPQAAGLPNASGLYNVSEFRINNKTLPYSLTDSTRWKDVVFEKWPTISIRSNHRVKLDLSNTEEIYASDKDRDYELEGSGERQYYSYTIDAQKKDLILQNKNKNYPDEQLVLHYSRPNGSQIILTGINEKKDSVYVVLDKLNKKYLLEEAAHIGRRGSLKL